MKNLLPLIAALLSSACVQAVTPEVVARGLDSPWAFAALPEGGWLVTERPGALRRVGADGKLSAPLAGVPAVSHGGQGGLHDVVLDRGFASNRQLFLCYAEPGEGNANGTALAKAKLKADGSGLEAVQVIFRQVPKQAGQHHFGCRIAEAADGTLFLSLGDRFRGMQRAQTLDSHLGKLVRVDKDGRAPADNPFVGQKDALPEIWSLGHRNSQGLTLDTQGRLWETEHGPQGGDELNLILRGRNYGWPVITYGENYGGGKIGEGITAKEGLEQPQQQWTPSIAPSGLVQLTSDAYGAAWKGSFFLGSLKFRYLERLQLQEGKPAVREKLLEGIGRVRDVRQGPDGLIYLLTEGENGQLIRLKP
jgi:glucose/arabinose dehydrogenase